MSQIDRFTKSFPNNGLRQLFNIFPAPPGKMNVEKYEDFLGVIKEILNSEQVKIVINSFVDMQRPRPLEIIAGVTQEA